MHAMSVDHSGTAHHPLHILFVAWGFPPHRGPGTYRPLATVNELARRGHRVTVLTADLDTFDLAIGGDNTLLEAVHPLVRILRVFVPQDAREPFINHWPATRVASLRAWHRALKVDQVQSFPESVYSPWGPRARAAALALHAQDPVDLCFATGNPYVDFTVALALNAEHHVPAILDDRDSWILDVYTGEELPEADRIRPWLEYALDVAVQMWFVNPPIADWHRTHFPDNAEKIHVVENGWDPRFLSPETFSDNPSTEGRLRFTFIGTVSHRLPLQLLADAWVAARRHSSLLASSEFHVVGQYGRIGTTSAEHARIRDEYMPHQMVFTWRLPKTGIGAAYAAADVLVFAKEGSGLVTSGKVYEYVATGRPIASVLAPEHDARRILSGYPRWHDAGEESADALAQALVAAAADAVDGAHRREQALAYGGRFRRDVLLADALDLVEQELAT